MGIASSTAKWAAPAAWAVDFAAQTYGILSTPNMKDVNDANQSFFSPQPYFVAAFFGPLQLLQLGWLYRLYRLDGAKPSERAELAQQVHYVPYYVVGNLSLAAWMFAWNSSHLDIAHGFVTLNTITQLYYMTTQLPPMNTRSTSSVFTHLVSKTFAAISVLDFLHNGSIAFFKDQPATMAVKGLTGVGFGLASAASDWIFGACLVYDLVAFAAGQSGDWRQLLGLYAIGAAGIVVVRNWFKPPYKSEYLAAPSDDDV